MTGTTSTYQPFQFDSLIINYTIPADADTLTDTITQVFYVTDTFYDTVYSFIRSIPEITTAIETAQKQTEAVDLILYPNPAKKHLNIRLDNITGEYMRVGIYGSQGQLIRSQSYISSLSGRINIESLAEGVYFVEVDHDGKKLFGRFIKTL